MKMASVADRGLYNKTRVVSRLRRGKFCEAVICEGRCVDFRLLWFSEEGNSKTLRVVFNIP
jgi:hypothetical protein